MKILAVDDKRLILLSVKKRLTELGCQVVIATSAKHGIELYNQFKPDLILLDINMPRIGSNPFIDCIGMEVVKYIRLLLKRKTPIMVFSGNTIEEAIFENYNLNINDYLKILKT
jgi:CheY-like chemotaxis protein